MASTLNSKRVFLMMLAAFGLLAAVVCALLLAAGVREPTRERLFLVGSIFVVSVVCLVLSFHFKDDAINLQESLDAAALRKQQAQAEDQDASPLPQNAPAAAEPDPDDVPLPQNQPAAEPDPDDVQLPQNQAAGK